jgi:hypothetical protein
MFEPRVICGIERFNAPTHPLIVCFHGANSTTIALWRLQLACDVFPSKQRWGDAKDAFAVDAQSTCSCADPSDQKTYVPLGSVDFPRFLSPKDSSQTLGVRQIIYKEITYRLIGTLMSGLYNVHLLHTSLVSFIFCLLAQHCER